MRNEILVIEKFRKDIFSDHSKFKAIYAFQEAFNKISIKNNAEKIPVSDELFTVRDVFHCDHRAASMAEKIIKEVLRGGGEKNNILQEIGGAKYAELLIKKVVMEKAAKVLYSFRLAENIAEKYKLSGDIFLMPDKLPVGIYNVMRKRGMLPENIKIPRGILLGFGIEEKFRNFFYLLKMAVSPELIMLKMRGKNHASVKQNYKIGVYVDGGETAEGYTGAGLFIDGKNIKKSDVLFVIDKNTSEEYALWIREKGFNYTVLWPVNLTWLSRKSFLKKHYYNVNEIRKGLLVFGLKNVFFISMLCRVLDNYMTWEFFYEQYNISNFIFMMNAPDLTRAAVINRHGAKSFFIYHSVTPATIERKVFPDRTEYAYYSYMIYDRIISDRVSNKLFKTYENSIETYYDNGSILSDVVYEVKHSNNGIVRQKINPGRQRLVSFFSQNVGPRCCFAYEDELIFLKSILEILESNNDFLVALKFKSKNELDLLLRKDNRIGEILGLLKANRYFISATELEINSYELMGASDLVIAGAISSVIYQSLIGGVKAISYDPAGRYKEPWMIHEQLPNIAAHNHEELERLIDFWLNKCNDEDFREFQDKYIKPNFDEYCDGKARERLRKIITA